MLESDFNSGFEALYLKPDESGDKKLMLTATYSSDSINWYTTSTEFSYHVNSWVEKNQTSIIIIGILLAFFSLPLPNYLFNRLTKKSRQ